MILVRRMMLIELGTFDKINSSICQSLEII